MHRALLLAVLAACDSFAGGGSGAGGGGDDDTRADAARGSGGGGGTDVFAAAVTSVVVEVDYEMGNEPYTGNAFGFGDTWAPTLTNIDRLFAGTKMLTIPTVLGDMENIGAIGDAELTLADLTAIADAHRGQHDTANTKTYYVVFVSGHFTDANGPNNAVLGISFGDTIAMFKDVIKSTSDFTNPNAVRYVEQSTMIHELAHSIGLVDNGVTMVAAHKDGEHGAHCNNPDCVMYWLNEGAADARAFALRRLLSNDSILFDAACLADADALTGGP